MPVSVPDSCPSWKVRSTLVSSTARGILRQMPLYNYMLQAIYEAVDSGEASAWIFFADFSKGFDLIDHSILMQELADLEVHPVLLSWIAAFLTSRKQAVRIGRTLSGWLTLKGGVPQGTTLVLFTTLFLFTVMTNKLLSDWRLRIKYVDDTSALEPISRNSPS